MISLNTFSIVAYSPEENAWGVAVASKFLAAGAIVSWARAGAGAVATQAHARVTFGPDALTLMRDGIPAEDVIEALIAVDEGSAHRQIGVVDAKGNAAAHTGEQCLEWAGHLVGKHFTCQGNILTGPETLEAMAEAFETTRGELADRLVAALLAGDTIGGDRRGKQSAAVQVVCPKAGYGGDNDHYLDLRVDDDPDPVNKLAQLVRSHHVFFGPHHPEDQLLVTSEIASELQTLMQTLGYYEHSIDGTWNDYTKSCFWTFICNENLEERWNPDDSPHKIDRIALDYLRQHFG